jgi:hypothetical protein
MVLRPTQTPWTGRASRSAYWSSGEPVGFTSVWYHEKGSLPALSQWRTRVVVVALSAPRGRAPAHRSGILGRIGTGCASRGREREIGDHGNATEMALLG